MRSIVTGNSNHDQDSTRIKIIQIMKDSNRIWGIRNKIHNGEWDDLEMLEVEDTIKDLLSQHQKINAIKYYRNYMSEQLNVDMGLRQAKDTIDAIGRGATVDLSVGYEE
jgi:ribosomal protein L7/L12